MAERITVGWQPRQTSRVGYFDSFRRIADSVMSIYSPPTLSDTVRKGDILITGRGIGGLVGHAAIMSSDNYVLEMPGGEGWQYGIPANNRIIHKYEWIELHKHDRTSVYRNVDKDVADEASDWAYLKYYNSTGGSMKTEQITYRLTNDVWCTDPSYCSKLVIQAYHFGTGSRNVIRSLTPVESAAFIVPSTLPIYFQNPYKLVCKGTF